MHRRTTAEEIWADLDGDVDVFVAGGGHGRHDHRRGRGAEGAQPGCARGRGRAGELAGPVRWEAGPPPDRRHRAGFVPDVLNREVIDEIIPVTDEDAIETARELASREGVSAGISAGAATWAALQVARPAGVRGEADRGRDPDSRRALRLDALLRSLEFRLKPGARRKSAVRRLEASRTLTL